MTHHLQGAEQESMPTLALAALPHAHLSEWKMENRKSQQFRNMELTNVINTTFRG